MTPEKKEKLLPRGIRVGILGAMGSGKTTIAEELEKRWPKAQIIPEVFVTNPFLQEFYQGVEGTSFRSQIWFLTERLSQLRGGTGIFYDPTSPRIDDPAFDNNYAFAETQYDLGKMSEGEWNIYASLFKALKESIPYLDYDFYIKLTASSDVLMQRIKDRGRDFETVSQDYIGLLIKNVEILSKLLEVKYPIIVINTGYYVLNDMEENLSRIESSIARLFAEGNMSSEEVSIPPFKSTRQSYSDYPPGGNPSSRRLAGT